MCGGVVIEYCAWRFGLSFFSFNRLLFSYVTRPILIAGYFFGPFRQIFFYHLLGMFQERFDLIFHVRRRIYPKSPFTILNRSMILTLPDKSPRSVQQIEGLFFHLICLVKVRPGLSVIPCSESFQTPSVPINSGLLFAKPVRQVYEKENCCEEDSDSRHGAHPLAYCHIQTRPGFFRRSTDRLTITSFHLIRVSVSIAPELLTSKLKRFVSCAGLACERTQICPWPRLWPYAPQIESGGIKMPGIAENSTKAVINAVLSFTGRPPSEAKRRLI